MSDIIKSKIVLDGLKNCLGEHNCLACPYSKYGGKKCQQKLLHDSEAIIITRGWM